MSICKCGFQMPRGGVCMLSPHKGRHSTVAYWCDGCGRYRRSLPVAEDRNQWDGITEGSFCFLCVRVDQR